MKNGFTLIELLVAISIIGIVFGIGMAKYNEFNRRQILVQAAEGLKSNLRLAQDKALAGEKGCTGALEGYRVTFSTTSYSFRSQCSEGDGPATTYSYYGGTQMASGPNSILFKVLAHGTDITGTAQIRLQLPGVAGEEVIRVTETGEIR